MGAVTSTLERTVRQKRKMIEGVLTLATMLLSTDTQQPCNDNLGLPFGSLTRITLRVQQWVCCSSYCRGGAENISKTENQRAWRPCAHAQWEGSEKKHSSQRSIFKVRPLVKVFTDSEKYRTGKNWGTSSRKKEDVKKVIWKDKMRKGRRKEMRSCTTRMRMWVIQDVAVPKKREIKLVRWSRK